MAREQLRPARDAAFSRARRSIFPRLYIPVIASLSRVSSTAQPSRLLTFAMLRPAFVALACAASLASAVETVVPTIASSPPKGTFGLERRVASLSIEFSYLPAFGGNATHPNLLTKRLIDSIVERTGVAPDLRPGGITVDSSVYNPTLPVGVQLVTSQVRLLASLSTIATDNTFRLVVSGKPSCEFV